MIKGIVAALALTGSLAAAPAAVAAPVDPAGALPGYGLAHAGHDHCPCEKPKPKHPEPHHHKGKSDSAHAGGDYDSHRHHPRNW